MPNQTMVYSCSGAEQEYTMVWFGIFLYLLISSLKIRFCEQSVFAKSPLLGLAKNPRSSGSWEASGVIGLQPLGRLEHCLSFGVFGAIQARGFCRIFSPFAFSLPLLLSTGSFLCFDFSWRFKLLNDPTFFPHTLQACRWWQVRCLFKMAWFG